MPKAIRTYPGTSFFRENVGLGAMPNEMLTVKGNISAGGSVIADKLSGTWTGNQLSSRQVNVEGIDIKSSRQDKDLFLKSIPSTFTCLLDN